MIGIETFGKGRRFSLEGGLLGSFRFSVCLFNTMIYRKDNSFGKI